MKKKYDEPWEGKDNFLYDISLNEKSTVLLIRVFGSLFQMQSSLIDLFSYNTNFDKYNILTIGTPLGGALIKI